MTEVCPTVLAATPFGFRQQIERLKKFADRIHIDVTDGVFAKHKTIDLDKIWWPDNLRVDIHVMYQNPQQYLGQLIRLKPKLIIVHAEADGNFYEILNRLRKADIAAGLALLSGTKVTEVGGVLNDIDHLLIFSGNLGHFGGHTDLRLLEKVDQARAINPKLEIGWDGGVNDENAVELIRGGVDVLNVGGFIERANDPEKAYDKLEEEVEGSK